MTQHENTITLVGCLCGAMTTVQTVSGRNNYHGTVRVKRQSGTDDVLQVLIPDRVHGNPFELRGERVFVRGEVISYTRSAENTGHRHLVLIRADEIRPVTICGPADNQHVCMEGVICKQPVYREVNSGRRVCELLIAVNRPGKSSYIPVITWGFDAVRLADAHVGDVVRLEGRFQSREYTKKLDVGEIVTRTAYEISAKTCRVIGMQRRLKAE